MGKEETIEVKAKRHTPNQIIGKPRVAERMLGEGNRRRRSPRTPSTGGATNTRHEGE
jgi:hypothetical protein